VLKEDFDYGVFCECWVFGRLIGIFDRVRLGFAVAVDGEMFERLINWREQLARARTGLSRAAASS
jgi:hypothetical protein